MADDRELTQLLSAEKFERIERAFHKHFQLGLETACGIGGNSLPSRETG